MRLSVDPELCVGHGRCYGLHPELFHTDDFGFASAVDRDLDGETELADARASVLDCPEHAITLT